MHSRSPVCHMTSRNDSVSIADAASVGCRDTGGLGLEIGLKMNRQPSKSDKSMRPATIYDYSTLYSGDYMRSGWLERATGIARMLDVNWDIVEVGAGRGDLARAMSTLGYHWTAYDVVSSPGVTAGELTKLHSMIPYRRYRCTVAIDVLEHLPESDIQPALLDLSRLAKHGVWSIANMSDVHSVAGVDVELHLTQRPPAWWADQIHILSGRSIVHIIDGARFWLEVEW